MFKISEAATAQEPVENVFCKYDALVPVGELVPNPDNPNTHPEAQVVLLAGMIDRLGWRAPITVSTLSGHIIRGHGRLAAAVRLGLDAVPVDYQAYTSHDEELQDLLADNQLPELAKMDTRSLALVLQSLDQKEISLEALGFTDKKYRALLKALAEITITPPEVPFTQELHESSNYLCLRFDNDVDWLQAQTLFQLETVQALDSKPGFQKKGIGRVLDGAQALSRILK